MPLPQKTSYSTDDIYSLPEGERAELIDGKFKTRLRVLARDSGQL